MRKSLVKKIVAFTAVAALVPALASAQVTTQRLYELGVDGGIEFGLNKPRTTSIGIPAQSLRLGAFVNEKWSIEPAFSLQSESGGGNRATRYTLLVGGLYHFSAAPTRVGTGWFARPFVGFEGVNVSGAGSDNRAMLGVGGGYKHQLAERFAARAEGIYSHRLAAGGNDGDNRLGISFGISFFTR